jgi:glycine/D-amino acid oxidase-like deaminating enzyme
MPPLGRPAVLNKVKLPPRDGLLFAETEVLVVGGGPAGLGAAVGAARAGANVILAEQYGFLGGNATAALVLPFTSFYTNLRNPPPKNGNLRLFPPDTGAGEKVIGGVMTELLERLVEAGGAVLPSSSTGYTVPFDPEIFKTTALEMLDDAGVNYLLHAFASGVLKEHDTTGVIFETKSGPGLIRARVIIDCTGDGDIAAMMGAPYEIGRAEDGLVQPMTLMFLMNDFQFPEFADYVRHHPEEWNGVQGLRELIRRAYSEGTPPLPRDDILFFGTTREHQAIINSTRIIKVMGTDVWDLTYAEREGRRQVKELVDFLRRYVPGFNKAYLDQSGSTVCARETRRIKGEYSLTEDDILQARKFPDVIARGTYPVDIHSATGGGTILKHLPPGEAYDIPLRCLLPKGVDNLVVAGRCISGTHEAQSSYRAMPICIATGHAAGVCAALAARQNTPPRDIAMNNVQDELIRQHANLRNIQ